MLIVRDSDTTILTNPEKRLLRARKGRRSSVSHCQEEVSEPLHFTPVYCSISLSRGSLSA